MKEAWNPRALPLPAFCRSGAALHGSWPLAALVRLGAGTAGGTGDAPPVEWALQGELRPVTGGDDEIWLHLRGGAAVRLTCQRCLGEMTEALQVDRRFRFVRGEAEAARLDELSDDDVLELPPRLDLRELLEDELILALPLVPRHGVCPQPLPLRDEPAEVVAAAPPNPFAALAALRKRGSGDGPADG